MTGRHPLPSPLLLAAVAPCPLSSPGRGGDVGLERTPLNIRTEQNVADSLPKDDSANTDPGPPGGLQLLLTQDTGPHVLRKERTRAHWRLFPLCAWTLSPSHPPPSPCGLRVPWSMVPRPALVLPLPEGTHSPSAQLWGLGSLPLVSGLGLNSSTISYRF